MLLPGQRRYEGVNSDAIVVAAWVAEHGERPGGANIGLEDEDGMDHRTLGDCAVLVGSLASRLGSAEAALMMGEFEYGTFETAEARLKAWNDLERDNPILEVYVDRDTIHRGSDVDFEVIPAHTIDQLSELQ